MNNFQKLIVMGVAGVGAMFSKPQQASAQQQQGVPMNYYRDSLIQSGAADKKVFMKDDNYAAKMILWTNDSTYTIYYDARNLKQSGEYAEYAETRLDVNHDHIADKKDDIVAQDMRLSYQQDGNSVSAFIHYDRVKSPNSRYVEKHIYDKNGKEIGDLNINDLKHSGYFVNFTSSAFMQRMYMDGASTLAAMPNHGPQERMSVLEKKFQEDVQNKTAAATPGAEQASPPQAVQKGKRSGLIPSLFGK